jgi:precorrin-6B methylase 2
MTIASIDSRSMRRLLAFVLLFSTLSVGCATGCAAGYADETPAPAVAATPIPPGPETYMGRTIATTMHYTGAPWLMRGSRAREEGTAMMLEQLGIRPGMTLCDMGCGNGYYTIPLAKRTGETGRVYAVDIQKEMLDLLGKATRDVGVDNVVPTLGTLVDPKLPDAAIDLMLLVDVYHEFSHPEQMLAAIRKSLAKDGRVVLVEFRLEDPKVPIKLLHKMSKAQILKELTANGFKRAAEFDRLPWQHMMTFVVDPAITPKPALRGTPDVEPKP